jgi:hypothetical protein
VADETLLPPIYETTAGAKKGDRRKTLQAAIGAAMEDLGYHHEFPVTTKIANKVFDLEWASRLIDDFSLGLHIFATGWLCDEDVEIVKMMNARADTLHQGTTTPTLADVATVLDHDLEVHIPQTIGQLRYGVEMSHAFWYVLLGPHHAVVREHLD